MTRSALFGCSAYEIGKPVLRPTALASFLVLALSFNAPIACAQKDQGFDNTKPSGQPYLSPEESLSRLHVPPGFEVKLFAAEPDIINPIAFTVDERGRLWVVECYEYPKRTPAGKKPRDRIKLLEDTTGSGKADKVTVWAEGKDFPTGFDLATGIEVGDGGVYLGAAPYLFFLRDSQGRGHWRGHCDEHQILLAGFGSQDTHETLNTLQWGPDGALYGLHGIFTRSRVGDVRLNAAVWRYHAASRKFEVFAEGTSNPWGLDFDAHGQAFVTACVIPHAYHIVPGGIYIRQAGSSFDPYAYGYLHEISDHLHHQESGWAHAGAMVLEGDDVPEPYRGSLLMGSIHGCSIKRDVLRRNGSTFVASHAPDFLTSGDKNFRPINLRWGPDGSIYVIDWHDQNPCHQAQADSWDMTHGRIYKIQRTANRNSSHVDLSKSSGRELVQLLKNNRPPSVARTARGVHHSGPARAAGRRRRCHALACPLGSSGHRRLR
jgi:putative membrane-bound dehydrogenase-like protein